MPQALFLKEDIESIIEHRKQCRSSFAISLDLGLRRQQVCFNDSFEELLLNGELVLDLKQIGRLKSDTVYQSTNSGTLVPLRFFSDETQLVYKLIPTKDWPSFTISSTPMHQVTFSSPRQDTIAKVALLLPLKPDAVALDTCFGLGYSANELSRHCGRVITFEVDENVLRLAKANPYSAEVFGNSRVEIRHADISAAITILAENSFDVILHDPPTFKYAPTLYSAAFYSELRRVLSRRGKLFHYCPRPNIKTKKRDFAAEVKKRLVAAGFSIERYSEDAQGLLAACP